jgi:hypothetical protein
MKIYESQGNLIGHRLNGRMIAEDQNYIWISNHAHTKDTLSPVFGVRSNIFTPDLPMDFDNMLGGPMNWDSNLSHRTANAHHYYTGNTMYKTTCNGQLNLLGINPTGKWVSLFEPDYYYYTPFTNTAQTNSLISYKIELATGNATQHARANYGGQVHFLHETSTQVFGYTNFYHGSGRFSVLNKGSLAMNGTLGLYSDAGNMNGPSILYKTDKYVTYFQCWHRSTDSAAAFAICRNAWSDTQNYTTTGYTRTSADGSTEYYEWTRNRLRKNIFKLNESGYDEDNSPDSYVNMATTHNYNLLSDRTEFDARSSFHMTSTPGIVHDHDPASDGLVKTYEKLRWYVPYCSTDGSFQILRYNMSISDTDNSPNYDVRKCVLSNSDPDNLQQPSIDTINSHDQALPGSTDRARQGVACAYFNDKKDGAYHHYLMLSFEDPTMRNFRQDGGRNYNKIYVYKILNHDVSIVDDIHELDSLDLELHQVIVEQTMSSGLLRPNFDPKLFIYFNSSDDHPVYIWNNTQQLFDKTHSINAPAAQMGADSEGRIYTCNYHSHRNFSVDMFTLDIPSKVSVKMDDNKFEYTGTPIDSELKVNSFNWKGERLASKVNLKVAGSGVVIIDSGNSDAEVTTLEVTTNDSSDLTIPIKIKSGSAVKINASVAPN